MVCIVPLVLIVPGVLFAVAIWVLLPLYLRAGMAAGGNSESHALIGLRTCAIGRLILIGVLGVQGWLQYQNAVELMRTDARTALLHEDVISLVLFVFSGTVILGSVLFTFNRRYAWLAAGSVLELPVALLFSAMDPVVGVPLLIISLASLRISEPAWRDQVLLASRTALGVAIWQFFLAVGAIIAFLFDGRESSYDMMRDGNEYGRGIATLGQMILIAGGVITFTNAFLSLSRYKRMLAVGGILQGVFGLLVVIWMSYWLGLIYTVAAVVSFGLSWGWFPSRRGPVQGEDLVVDHAG